MNLGKRDYVKKMLFDKGIDTRFFFTGMHKQQVYSGNDERDLLRVLTSRAINLMANIILNFKIKDYDSGFVAAKKEVFDKVIFNPKGHREYCIEFLYGCTKKKLKVKEVGYICEERKKGTSKSNPSFFGFLKFGVQYAVRIIKLRLNV